jgi:hypothetical protein
MASDALLPFAVCFSLSAGLFGCFDDCGICLLTSCFAPIQYGMNQDKLHPGVSSSSSSSKAQLGDSHSSSQPQQF